MKSLSRRQVRELDADATERYGIPGVVLMENAGRGVVDTLCGLGAESPVSICCGQGNNGGDGFVIARHLQIRGIEPRVLLWAPPKKLRGDAATNFEIAMRSGIVIEIFERAADVFKFKQCLHQSDWIVDALLGTGARGLPRSPLDVAIEAINNAPARVLAVDVPSGMDCDTGDAAGAVVRANHTCTFVAPKPGFFTKGAVLLTGELHVLDIGAPRELVDRFLSERD